MARQETSYGYFAFSSLSITPAVFQASVEIFGFIPCAEDVSIVRRGMVRVNW